MFELEIFDIGGRWTIAVGSLPFSIGCGSDNHFQLSDVPVSRRHAVITGRNGGCRIRDCGSPFGTFRNEQGCTLRRSVRIRLGRD